jgi:multicomponent Na+:H+ antiporter subunit G
MTDLLIYLGAFFLLGGALFCLLASLGVLRLPDIFSRMHAASKAGAVGGGMILFSVALVSFESATALRALIGIGFVLLTTPVSAHLLARAAYRSGIHPKGDQINKPAKSNQEQS